VVSYDTDCSECANFRPTVDLSRTRAQLRRPSIRHAAVGLTHYWLTDETVVLVDLHITRGESESDATDEGMCQKWNAADMECVDALL